MIKIVLMGELKEVFSCLEGVGGAKISLDIKSLAGQLTEQEAHMIYWIKRTPESPQKECSCKEPGCIWNKASGNLDLCINCGLPIPPKPIPAEIKELGWSMGQGLLGTDEIVRLCVDKINELIVAVNKLNG
jgi:hypothetical protein